MEAYGYSYPAAYPPMVMRPPEREYPDHGDGFGEYYGLGPLNEERGRRSRSKQRVQKKESKRARSARSDSASKSRSHSRSKSRSKSRSRSRSQSHGRSRSRSRSRSATHQKEFTFREPSFLDAFRVLYLTPSKTKKTPLKYLATNKQRDRIQEILKSDRLGSKHWFFYPRNTTNSEPPPETDRAQSSQVAGSRDNCDQRIKIDGDFFRKYKRSKKIDTDAPIAKLKRWELLLYKKIGFVQAV